MSTEAEPSSRPGLSGVWSIHARLLLVASLVLVAFLGLGALALDRAFSESAENAARERLLGQIYVLLGAAEEDALGRMRLPADLPDPRLSNPDSGIYAEVGGEQGEYSWRSASLLGRPAELVSVQPAGSQHFSRRSLAGGQAYVLNFGVQWEDDQGRALDYTLAVAEDTRAIEAQVEGFRGTLLYWLGGSALLLLLAQGLVLAWGLQPLRRIAVDLKRVESGEIDSIEGRYPAELRGLIGNLNILIRSGRASRDRYRNSLGDLAHSLKTPLTLLLGVMESGGCSKLRAAVREQVPRMDEIVHYQLRRAAASTNTEPGTAIPLLPLIRRLATTLEKVYRDKRLHCEVAVAADVRFFGDEGDAMEILGNLMDNACKFARAKLRVSARSENERQDGQALLHIMVEDDGPGIPSSRRADVLGRGVRADQRVPGQGIGLSVARELVQLYGGRLSIGESKLGGAAFHLQFPTAGS